MGHLAELLEKVLPLLQIEEFGGRGALVGQVKDAALVKGAKGQAPHLHRKKPHESKDGRSV